MNETTQITYRSGTITITMDSASTYEVAVSNIRFGDYAEAAKSCFTDRELEQIADGAMAELKFDFVMCEAPEDPSEEELFLKEISEKESVVGPLHIGAYFKVEASKSISGSEPVAIRSFDRDVELQFDIPLYLVAEDREYFAMTNVMGECEFLVDADEEADTFSVNTHYIGTTVLLYQDSNEALLGKKEGFHIRNQHLFIGGIVVLALLWWVVNKIHKI